MKMTQKTAKPRALVAIASYGEKNLACLQRLIDRYRSMALDVDVIVTSEAPKSVDLGVEVVVGTPTKNPHSLPFAHKRLFAENVGRYDLFVYTEDDIDISEESLLAFGRISDVLAPNEIAGFIRYELGTDGTRSLPDVHGRFRWRPESVRRRGDYTVAEFTNEHAGFYVLTNQQLQRAIASGAFLSAPYEGRYEMLESAATDVYVNCGFRKVIAISHVDMFLVHHMPNRYVGQMGVPLSLVREQIETLMKIERGEHPASTLFEVEPKVLESKWGKRYDERPSPDLLKMVPAGARTVLSIGCGLGATEAKLRERGATVTVFPLDSVVGATLQRQGVHVIFGTLEECLKSVESLRFDCVLLSNLIHLLPQPWAVLHECAKLVGENGALVVEGQNFERFPVLVKRAVGAGLYRQFGSYSQSGVQVHSLNTVNKMVRRAGLDMVSVRWSAGAPSPLGNRLPRWFRRFAAPTWILRAERARLQRPAA